MSHKAERTISLPLRIEQAIIALHETDEFSNLSYSCIVEKLIELGLATVHS
ncbi:MAG: hypothetical protein RR053_07980 [Evtepia sp.]